MSPSKVLLGVAAVLGVVILAPAPLAHAQGVTITWITPPPAAITAGTAFTVSYNLATTGSVARVQVRWGTDPDPRVTFSGASGFHTSAGTKTETIAVVTNTAASYYFVVHASVNGRNYYSTILARAVAVPTPPPAVNWVNQPPASIASGTPFSVTFSVTGGVSLSSVVLQFGTNPNPRTSFESTGRLFAQRGNLTDTVTLQATAETTWYFVVKARVDGAEYFSPVVASRVTAPPAASVSWITQPPATIVSGVAYSVSYNVTGSGTVSHVDVHWGASPDPRGTALATAPASAGAGNKTGTINVNVTSAAIYYFVAHATIGGREYYSPIVSRVVRPPAPAVSWTAPPPASLTSGVPFAVSYTAAGGAISRVVVQYGTFPDPRANFTGASPGSNTGGSKSETLTINTATAATYYFVARVTAGGLDYFSPLVSAVVLPASGGAISVQWMTPPPSTVGSATQFSVIFNQTGPGTVSHFNVHYGVDPNPRVNYRTFTPVRAAGGTFTENILISVASDTTYYFVAHARVDGADYYSPVQATVVQASAATPRVDWLLQPPNPATSGRPFMVSYNVSGGRSATNVDLRWGTETDPRTNFTFRSPVQISGGIKNESITLNVTQNTTYYFVARAEIDGQPYFSPVVSAQVLAPVTGGLQDRATMVSENLVGDPVLSAGLTLNKTWTVQNTGTTTWGSGYALAYVSGNAGANHSTVQVSGNILPGSNFTFSVPVTVPLAAGSYREDWGLLTPSGNPLPLTSGATLTIQYRVGTVTAAAHDGATLLSETPLGLLAVQAGATFTKSWSFRNSGISTWNSYVLAFVAAAPAGGASLNLSASSSPSIPVGATPPGGVAVVTLQGRAPAATGSYVGYWQLQSSAGVMFGPPVSAQVSVQATLPAVSFTNLSQSYALATSQLTLQARPVDSMGVLSSGLMTWALLDAAGSGKESGVMTYASSSGWTHQGTIPRLTGGRYTVRYSYTEGARSGTATGTFTVQGRFNISGRVRERSAAGGLGSAVAGVTVQLGSRSATSNAQGNYAINDFDTAAGFPNLTTAHSLYESSSQAVNWPSTGTQIVQDLVLVRRPLVSTKPAVRVVTAEYSGIFVHGLVFVNQFEAQVLWCTGPNCAGTPGTLRFLANGSLKTTVRGTAQGGLGSLDMGKDFTGALNANTNKVTVIATNAQGLSSDPFDLPVEVIPAPDWLKPILPFFSCTRSESGRFGQKKASCSVGLSFSSPLPGTVDIPLLGKFGADLGVSGDFRHSINPAQNKLYVGTGVGLASDGEDDDDNRNRNRNSNANQSAPRKKPKFFAGKKTIDIELEVTAVGTPTVTRGIRFDILEPAFGINTKFEVGRFGLLDVAPGASSILSKIPGASKISDAVSIRIYLILGLDGKLRLRIDPRTSFEGASGNIRLGVEGAYEKDLGIVDVRAYVGALIAASMQYPASPFLRDMSGKLYAGLTASNWLFEGGFECILVQYPSGRARCKKTGDLAGPFWQPLNRGYLRDGLPRFVAETAKVEEERAGSKVSAWERFRLMGQPRSAQAAAEDPAQADLPLLENVYPYSRPSLASRGEELMLVYVSDNGQADMQFGDIHWMRFDGARWTAPAAIAVDTRGEFAPSVAFDGSGDAIAVWQRIKDPAFNTVDPEVAAKLFEIIWSRWDRASNRWSAPAVLTDNDFLDHLPAVVGPMTGGSVMLLWTQNAAGLVLGTGAPGSATADNVLWTLWNPTTRGWATPQMLVSLSGRESQSLAGTRSKAVYAWVQEQDGDPATPNDREVYALVWNGTTWAPPVRLTNDATADKNVKAAVTASGDIYLVWRRGSDLVMSRNLATPPSTVRTDAEGIAFETLYLTVGPEGNVVLLWSDDNETGRDPFYRVYDPASESWSQDARLFSDPTLERSFAPAWDDAGNLTLAYNRVEVKTETRTLKFDDGTEEEVTAPAPGRVDLGIMKRRLVKDVGFQADGLVVDGNQFLGGETVDLEATVRNLGDLAVSDLVVAFYNGDPASGGIEITRQVVAGWLAAGASTKVTAQWTLPNTGTSHTVYVFADPDRRETEINEANNTLSVSLGGTDLALTVGETQVDADGSARIVVEVRNNGAPASPATTVSVAPSAGGAAVASAAVPALEPGRSTELALDLPAGTVPAAETLFVVAVDEASAIADVNPRNNAARVALRSALVGPPAVGAPALAPNGGSFPMAQNVTITCPTAGSMVHYTTSGAEPTEDDPAIPCGAMLPVAATTTLKAKAFLEGVASATATATYTITVARPEVRAVANGASFSVSGGRANGSLISIFGGPFANREFAAAGLPLPTTLGGVRVLVGGVPAPLLFVNPSQINLQLPWEVEGPEVPVVVEANGNVSAEINIRLAPADPSIFLLGATGYGAIVKANTTVLAVPVSAGLGGAPVTGGDIISIFCTGLGDTRDLLMTGQPAPGANFTTIIPAVLIGGEPAPVLYSGLAPGFVGLYQINVMVPIEARKGDRVPVVIEMGPTRSNSGDIAIQ